MAKLVEIIKGQTVTEQIDTINTNVGNVNDELVQLKNDALTIETTPVKSVNGKLGEVSLTAVDVGAFPNDATIKELDINNIKTTGVYIGTIASNPYYLVVIRYSNTNVYQKLIGPKSSKFRRFTGTWSEWVEAYSNENPITASDVTGIELVDTNTSLDLAMLDNGKFVKTKLMFNPSTKELTFGSETYATKSYVETLFKQISSEIVDKLPDNPRENVIYFVPADIGDKNQFNEWIWVNGTWEIIGGTDVDLTPFLTIEVAAQTYATKVENDGKVSKTTTINSKPLSSNITLTAEDVGALPADTPIPNQVVNRYSNAEIEAKLTDGSFKSNDTIIAIDDGTYEKGAAYVYDGAKLNKITDNVLTRDVDQNIDGIKNFTGVLRANGVAVATTTEIEDLENKKLDKMTERDMVYATDKFGNQTSKQYNIEPLGDGIVERTQDGRVKGTTAVEDNDLVTLEQFNSEINVLSQDKQESERYTLATDEVTQEVALDILTNYANHEGKIIEFLTNKEAPNKSVAYGFCMSDKDGNQFLIVLDKAGQITQWNKNDYRKNNVEYQLLDGLVDCDNLTLDKVGDSAKYYAGLNNPMNNPENVGDYGALMVLPYDFRNQLQIYIDITTGKFYFRKVTGTDGNHSFGVWNKMGASDIISLPVGTNLLTYNWNDYSNGTWFKGKELLGLPQDITEHTEMMIQLVKYENDRYAIMLYHTGIYEAHVNTFINYHYADKFRGWEKFATNIVDASEGAKGIIQIANDVEVSTGTNDTKAITPKKLKEAIDKLGAILNFKGVKDKINELPTTDNKIGDVWYVKENSGGYVWIDDKGTKRWEELGAVVDLSAYVLKTDIVNSFVSTATDKPLSAYIGNQLYSQLSQKAGKDEIPSVAGFIKNEPNAFDYNNLKGKPTIPTKLSELSGDATHRVVTDTEKSTWNNKSNFDGNYNSLSNKPTIPDISGLATKTELGNKYDKTGGTINGAISATGNVSGNYLIGNWIQTKTCANLGSGTYDVPVLRSDGWIYKRTKSEFASDIGVATLNSVYPVGSVYMSFKNVSPASFIGGVWEPINNARLITGNSLNVYGKGNTTIPAIISGDGSWHGLRTNSSMNPGNQSVVIINNPKKLTNSNLSIATKSQMGGSSAFLEADLTSNLSVYAWKRTA